MRGDSKRKEQLVPEYRNPIILSFETSDPLRTGPHLNDLSTLLIQSVLQ